MDYSTILTFDGPQVARVRAYFVKISFLEGSQNLKMSIFGAKNVGKIQSKIGTPKIDTFSKFWAHTNCVNLWRRTVGKL